MEFCQAAHSNQALPPGLALPADRLTLGVNPDWDAETLHQFAATTGMAPGVAGSFVQMPLTADDRTRIQSAADEVASIGGVLMMTLEPHQGLDAVDDASVQELVALLATLNDSSVPVLLRFAHEMNGSWYPWGQQPQSYVAAFRKVAQAVEEGTTATEMMWAPNYGGGYPFAGGEFASAGNPSAPGAGAANFEWADTNSDGALTEADDPYEPYYPGDDVVDWVGLTIYHYGGASPWDGNNVPEPDKFAAQLRGAYDGLGGDESGVLDFYARYAEDRDKTMAIPETAAFVTAATEPDLALEIKQGWWRQVYSPDMRTKFPQLRLVNWFNSDKPELESVDLVRWSVTTDERIADGFGTDLADSVATAADVVSCPEVPEPASSSAGPTGSTGAGGGL